MNRRTGEGILDAVGRTPLVRLRKLFEHAPFEVYAKLESTNPGGSAKDRPATEIVNRALEEGVVSPGGLVIESSSGNMGIGLAQACRYHGLRFLCVTDVKTTAQNLALLRAYGAEIEMVEEPDPETGEFLQARLRRVRDLQERFPEAYWPNQYANPANSSAHYRTTIREIVDQLDGRLDYLFCAVSTCGTMRGCAEFIRDHGLPTRMIVVDAVGSLIFADEPGPRSIPGLGAGLRPPLCAPELIERCVHVDDLDCVVGCRRLVRHEAIFAGGSSGGVIRAVEKVADELPAGSVCAAILVDRGERYLDTVYDDDWVRERFGAVEDRWEEEPRSLAGSSTPSRR